MSANASIFDSCTSAIPAGFDTFTDVFAYVLLVTSIVSNAFSITALYCAAKLHRRSGDTMHIFVISMTVADMLSTAYSNPYLHLTNLELIRPYRVPCTASQIFLWLGIATSGLSLVLLNVDKFVYFRWPLRYLLLSTKRAVLLVGIAWGITLACVSCVWSFGVVYIDSDQLSAFCNTRVEPRTRIVYHIFVVFFCIVPVVSSLLLSLYLARLTSRRHQRLSPPGSVFNTDKLKSLVLIFTTTLWTSATLLPYRLWYYITVWTIVPDSSCTDINARVETSTVLLLFLYLNPVVNPLFTLIVHAPYRRLIQEKASLAYKRVLAARS